MPTFQSYPTKKSTPSRNTRKGMRRTVFLANKKTTKKAIARASQGIVR
jgi:hypothetical protein